MQVIAGGDRVGVVGVTGLNAVVVAGERFWQDADRVQKGNPQIEFPITEDR
ncbi:MAG: hypothetical protein RL648_795 [Verrucomicrobiota bacterium]|jgi:hypothetical protein